MCKIIVSGASSFIGYPLIKRLINDGHFVYALARKSSPALNLLLEKQNFRIIYCPLEEIESLPRLISDTCDTFYHLAWAGIRGKDRENIAIQNFNYTQSVKMYMAAIRLGCRNFIMAGSQAEYGNVSACITEEKQCRPISQYGINKLRFYDYGMDKSQAWNVTFREPRFFSLYGPNDNENTMISVTLKKMIKGLECEFTTADHLWDFLYVDDAVNAMVMMVNKKTESGAYNVAFGHSFPLNFFIQQMKIITKTNSILKFGMIEYPPEGKQDLKVSIEKISHALKWKPEIEFASGIKNTINNLKVSDKYEKN